MLKLMMQWDRLLDIQDHLNKAQETGGQEDHRDRRHRVHGVRLPDCDADA